MPVSDNVFSLVPICILTLWLLLPLIAHHVHPLLRSCHRNFRLQPMPCFDVWLIEVMHNIKCSNILPNLLEMKLDVLHEVLVQ